MTNLQYLVKTAAVDLTNKEHIDPWEAFFEGVKGNGSQFINTQLRNPDAAMAANSHSLPSALLGMTGGGAIGHLAARGVKNPLLRALATATGMVGGGSLGSGVGNAEYARLRNQFVDRLPTKEYQWNGMPLLKTN